MNKPMRNRYLSHIEKITTSIAAKLLEDIYIYVRMIIDYIEKNVCFNLNICLLRGQRK